MTIERFEALLKELIKAGREHELALEDIRFELNKAISDLEDELEDEGE